jgi:hypothetical protein
MLIPEHLSRVTTTQTGKQSDAFGAMARTCLSVTSEGKE